jgi:hypothetical protein
MVDFIIDADSLSDERVQEIISPSSNAKRPKTCLVAKQNKEEICISLDLSKMFDTSKYVSVLRVPKTMDTNVSFFTYIEGYLRALNECGFSGLMKNYMARGDTGNAAASSGVDMILGILNLKEPKKLVVYSEKITGMDGILNLKEWFPSYELFELINGIETFKSKEDKIDVYPSFLPHSVVTCDTMNETKREESSSKEERESSRQSFIETYMQTMSKEECDLFYEKRFGMKPLLYARNTECAYFVPQEKCGDLCKPPEDCPDFKPKWHPRDER